MSAFFPYYCNSFYFFVFPFFDLSLLTLTLPGYFNQNLAQKINLTSFCIPITDLRPKLIFTDSRPKLIFKHFDLSSKKCGGTRVLWSDKIYIFYPLSYYFLYFLPGVVIVLIFFFIIYRKKKDFFLTSQSFLSGIFSR